MMWTKLKFVAAASLLCIVAWGAMVSAQVFERPAQEPAPAAEVVAQLAPLIAVAQTPGAPPDRLESRSNANWTG